MNLIIIRAKLAGDNEKTGVKQLASQCRVLVDSPHLRPITIDNTSDTNNNIPKTRVIRISEPLYRRFVGHSKRFYNVESYEVILSDLLDCYSKHYEPDYSHFHSCK